MRYRRKLRGTRQTEVQHVKQPGLTISVRQPEKISLLSWPSLPQLRAWLQHLRQSWRVLTCGGEHAEVWLEKAIELAQKTKADAEFWSKLELLICDVPEYNTAVEKLALELVGKFDEKLQRELAVLQEKRGCRAWQLWMAANYLPGRFEGSAEIPSGIQTAADRR